VGDLFDADAVFLGLAISADVLAWLREEAAWSTRPFPP
jgi:hypothetical protein